MTIALSEIIYFWRINRKQTNSLLYKILGGTVIFSFLAFYDFFYPNMLSFISVMMAIGWGASMSLIIAILLPAYINNYKILKIIAFIGTVVFVLFTISLFKMNLDLIMPVIGCLGYYFVASFMENKIKAKLPFFFNILATISFFLFTTSTIILFGYFIRIVFK